MAISLQFWVIYVANNVKLQRKSENAVSCNNILQFLYDSESKTVNAIVQTSMCDRSYKIQVCPLLVNVTN